MGTNKPLIDFTETAQSSKVSVTLLEGGDCSAQCLDLCAQFSKWLACSIFSKEDKNYALSSEVKEQETVQE